ncbi:hypothetical protein HG536_0B05070 [Torulaspora globosa]|uniref:Sas10 C-terminal domain-containing protein n=1 Tax=Torulaspora globosa TaxID=48254 RepID=A0A7G3ZDQ7_9SACH|nr:uncharacterized protein HG536_0B05070 [Torulaspora globosa]QLL31643.1 hypothetical protein HG536_0B05070 [Torulaspora globosa]
MARRRAKNSGSRQPASARQAAEDAYGMTEVDEFASKKDKLLFEQSTLAGDDDQNGFDNPYEEEEEVLAMSNESSSEEDEEEEEELDGERAYRKVFGRKLNLREEAGEDEAESMLDNDGAWGTSKGDYYGADDIEDEETAKEVEKEALRQKKKHLEELNMNDYLDEELDEDWAKSAREADVGEFKEVTKQSQKVASIEDLRNMDGEAKREYIKALFPEFVPLSKELSKLSVVLEELRSQEESEVISLKICALSSYLGTLSSYFGILLHELDNNDNFSTMRDHPIMETILTSKEVWRQASALTDQSEKMDEEQQHGENELTDEESKEFDVNHLGKINGETGSDNGDEEPISDEENREQDENEDEDDEEDDEEDVDLDDFEEYVKQSRVPSRKNNNKDGSHIVDDADDYLEGQMADVDSQEKRARRRTLRFYTSKIDQSENKKTERYKGDDDIPYKERLFERQQRLLEEARKRGQQGPSNADLDAKDYDSSDEATSKAMNKESEEDFFEMTRRQKQSKKDARKQAHKDAVKAARDGKLAELAEELGEDGKRAINYQILKNKGLTPKRKKDNRNSRVKKRKKFEKAQKKLKSIRAVYSGGQSGVYEGEKTGIKKNLIKSVKFTN